MQISGNIYLMGFMGSGKSTVGRLLAQSLNREFFDMDEALVEEFKSPIHEVFARRGEQVFREREKALLETISARSRLVAAGGGGVPVDEENRNLMKNSGTRVFLKAALETCRSRLTADEIALRPMWKDQARAESLFRQRQDIYSDNELEVVVDGLEPQKVVESILAGLFPEERFTARLGRLESPVICNFTAPESLHEFTAGRRVMLLTDENVGRLYLDRYLKVLGDIPALVLPAGEKTKTLAGATRVYETLLENRLSRDDLLIALGGGVMTDLGAFVGATFKRGMKFLLVSTSLLGCVDAVVGGKAAVNLGEAKNSVGCFTVPEAVIQDLASLRTLEPDQVGEGLIEAYKTGLVAAPDLAELIEKERDALKAKDLPFLAHIASRSARAKASVVARDFTEDGWRGILNFGHTYGHAVEGWHEYRVSHGQSVAMGMIAAVRISKNRGLLSAGEAERIESTVRFISPCRDEWPPADEAWKIMEHDKKIRKGRMVFVLLAKSGEPVLVNDITREELAAVLETLRD